MLLIADAKGYRRETVNVQCPRLVESETNMAPLKDSVASVMHERESVATGAGCKRDLCRFICWLEPGVDGNSWSSVLLMVLAQRDTHNVLQLVDWHYSRSVFGITRVMEFRSPF
jgi:hypothetical protein